MPPEKNKNNCTKFTMQKFNMLCHCSVVPTWEFVYRRKVFYFIFLKLTRNEILFNNIELFLVYQFHRHPFHLLFCRSSPTSRVSSLGRLLSLFGALYYVSRARVSDDVFGIRKYSCTAKSVNIYIFTKFIAFSLQGITIFS